MEENTQLPKEVVDEIKAHAIDYANGIVFNSAWMTAEKISEKRTEASEDYQAGATAYATKLHQANETIKVLEYDNNRLKGEVEGLKGKDAAWVKASERLPGWRQSVKWKSHEGAEVGKHPLFAMTDPGTAEAMDGWEWYDESAAGDNPEPKWVKGALQWAKETIDFAWDYVKVPESLVETWGNMYMNTMHAIQQAQQETESAAGREGAVEFAEWIREQNYKPYAGSWFLNGNNYAHQPHSTRNLYELFKQQKEK